MIKKIKKVLMIIGMFLITMPIKAVSALNLNNLGEREVDLYGIVDPGPRLLQGIILNMIKNLILPIVLIIGSVVYIKKSKSSKKRKIITIVILIAAAIALSFLIGYIIKIHNDNVLNY